MSSYRFVRPAQFPAAAVEALETRRLLAGNVTATLSPAGVLRVTGDAEANRINLRVIDETVAGRATVRSGTTSVALDTTLLESAAGLTLSSANSAGTAANGFAVGFPISPDTDFTYDTSPFAVQRGAIRHTGTVGFNDNAIIVGNFEIDFDPNRATGDNSGFFVRDTVGGLGILFDVASPQGLSASDSAFTVTSSDLVVSPEFAQVLLAQNLATADLTGADVGDARIDGLAATTVRAVIEITGQDSTTINSGTAAVTFERGGIRALRIATLAGDDTIIAGPMRFTKIFSVDAGDGNDQLFLTSVWLNRASTILMGAGNDYANIFAGRSPRALAIDGGAGTDVLVRTLNAFSSLDASNFETVLPA
jgi:hypothetical protein